MNRPRLLRRNGPIPVVLAVALVGWSLLGGVASAASVPVSGGGSSFAAPEIQQWQADVAQAPYDLTVDYAVGSSGGGRDGYANANGLLQFAATDNVYYAQDGGDLREATSEHAFTYVPVTAGGLAFVYNIVIDGQRWTGLNLTDQEACQIFTGQLSNWGSVGRHAG
jgi:phosphate transport system substrate-binding protein